MHGGMQIFARIRGEDKIMSGNNEKGMAQDGLTDCCFSHGDSWFRYRTAALIIEDDALLLVTNPSVSYYYTVGGGVHLGERAEDCVLREVMEETGTRYEIDRLAAVCENFFTGHEPKLDGMRCHVIEFYFLMRPRGSRRLGRKITDMGESLHWIPLESLASTDVLPVFLRTRLGEILAGDGVLHIIDDER